MIYNVLKIKKINLEIKFMEEYMVSFFKKSEKIDKKIYYLKQVEQYLDKTENIKRDKQDFYFSLGGFVKI